MSYPLSATHKISSLQHKLAERNASIANLQLVLQEVEHEREQWRNAHGSVVAQKRRLSAKYGAIMRNKPRARLTRLRKWLGGRR